MKQNLEKLITETAENVDQFRKDLNTHILPPLYGIRKALNPHYNGTYKLYEKIEKQREKIANDLTFHKVEWKPYERYTLYLKDYLTNPGDMMNRDKFFRLFLFSAAQIETRIYCKYMDRYLYRAKEAYNDRKKTINRRR